MTSRWKCSNSDKIWARNYWYHTKRVSERLHHKMKKKLLETNYFVSRGGGRKFHENDFRFCLNSSLIPTSNVVWVKVCVTLWFSPQCNVGCHNLVKQILLFFSSCFRLIWKSLKSIFSHYIFGKKIIIFMDGGYNSCISSLQSCLFGNLVKIPI